MSTSCHFFFFWLLYSTVHVLSPCLHQNAASNSGSFSEEKESLVHTAHVSISGKFSVKLSGYYWCTHGLCTYTAMYGENTETKQSRREQANCWFLKDLWCIHGIEMLENNYSVLWKVTLLTLPRRAKSLIARFLFLSLENLASNWLMKIEVVKTDCFHEGRYPKAW